MSTQYGLRKSIKADELFDGRLEAFGVREEVRPEGAADRFPPYMKVRGSDTLQMAATAWRCSFGRTATHTST
jgi:hypothetical protein